MKVLDKLTGFFTGKNSKEETKKDTSDKGVPKMENPPPPPEKKIQPSQQFGYGGGFYGQSYPTRNAIYDGEKTLGELGMVLNNIIDHRRLRMRAYDAYLKTDIAKIIMKRFMQHVIGDGLKLQAEPNINILAANNIQLPDDWTQNVEEMFKLMASTTYFDYSDSQSLHQIGLECYKTAEIGGDCLVITRFEDRKLTVQLVDGQHIVDPYFEPELMKDIEKRGNFLQHGVEYDKKGKIVAFYIVVDQEKEIFGKIKRIEARSNTGLETAWLVYGEKFRLDHKRGIPRIANTIEKINKIDRYSEAAVGKAEQAANIFVAIQHNDNSTGENPFLDQISRNLGTETENNLNSYAIADGKAREIYQGTSNMAVNLPPGAELKQFSTDIESQYSDFYRANFDAACASVDLPPEVALQSYNSNYSASKAALDNWQYIVDIHRKGFSGNFYNRIYKLWLTFEILEGRIEAPGFVKAFANKNAIVLESYYQSRFTGRRIPHIDPLKEIKAIRAMLGDESTPLMSFEQAAEQLNLGQWSENLERLKREMEQFPELTNQENNSNQEIKNSTEEE